MKNTSGQHHEYNIVEYWRIVRKYRKMVIYILSITSVLAVVLTLHTKNLYKAEAVIVPVTSRSGGGNLAAMASQFGGLASMAGINVPSVASDLEKLTVIVKSRTVAENVINRENLMPILLKDKWDEKRGQWKSSDPKKQPTMEAGVYRLRMAVKIAADKKNKTIVISCVMRDPVLAAKIVNIYIDELQKFINANAFTTAKRNRIFIEEQLQENKAELLEAGKEINEFYTNSRISSAEAKVDVELNGHSDTREPSLASGQTQVLTNDGNGTPTASLESDINNLIAQKTDIENKIVNAKIVSNVPQQVFLSYLMMRRELLGKVNSLLTTQYEMAKIEESKEDLAFQVIDKAVPPVMKFAPKRAQTCIMWFITALFISVFIAFFREHVQRMKAISAAREV